MNNDEAREMVASLRKGDKVEIVYRETFSHISVDSAGFLNANGTWHWFQDPFAVYVIEHAEPPVGTPVWFRGEWWIGVAQPNARARYFRAVDIGANDWRVWETMTGAIPAATPEETP